jgi:hypothetical protein
LILLSFTILVSFPAVALASGPDESQLDAAALSQMEQRADAAQPRDQCYMFTEVLHGLTELAGRQIAAGDQADASTTIEHIDAVAAKVRKASSDNPKRLKNAELLLEHITRRFTDMAHVATGAERSAMQSTMQTLDKLHTQVLTMVFAR